VVYYGDESDGNGKSDGNGRIEESVRIPVRRVRLRDFIYTQRGPYDMTKEEAYREYRRKADLLTFPLQPDNEQSAPIVSLKNELERIVEQIKTENGFRKNAYVEKRLADSAMLVRALVAPTEIVWSEPSGETERDPVSGNPRPKMKRCQEAAPIAQGLFEIRDKLLACTRALAAYAKHIDSPAYGEWREIYISLEAYFAHHNKVNPMEEAFAEDAVARFDAALFALWADNEIAMEAHHV